MTAEILGRLGFDAASKQERPYIAEDFVFDAARFPSARTLRVVHEAVMLEETPWLRQGEKEAGEPQASRSCPRPSAWAHSHVHPLRCLATSRG